MSMHVKRHMNISDISVRASSYGIPGRAVDGNDINVVYEAAREARAYARTQGPYLLVLNTYRIMGHSKSDAGLYRTKEEVEEWKAKDPIKRLRSALADQHIVSAGEIDALDARAANAIEKAVEYAEASAEPSVETVEEDVYA
jgi:TPP-dependent pyruvate/acetoin dehydrogenase alpha subunit